jgi:O-antigen/teichoic acid export membrane protein
MSRIKRFTHSLLSGYLVLGANMFYTLASVPLALHYLSRVEFGLWALTTQIAQYVALIDLGMSSSMCRFLIDHKDDKSDGAYGGIIRAGALVGVVQGALIVLVGTGLAFCAAPLFNLSGELRGEFFWLLTGQSALLGLQFGTRISSQLLIAHQRFDIPNYATVVLFGVSLLGMWAGFAAGLGVFSYLVAQTLSTLIGAVVTLIICLRLKLFPGPGEWGRVTREKFRELFAFGRDAFLMNIGSQLISASQTMLLTRFLGLDMAAVWSVCTRTYTLMTALVWRLLDYSGPALIEMMVRGERDRLLQRFKDLVVLSASLAIAGGGLFVVCNDPFVRLWTSGRIHWSPLNDLLLAVWFVFVTQVRVHTALASSTKRFGFLRFVFLVEGLAFVGLTLLAHGRGGVTMMLAFSVLCTMLFSFPYGLWRTREYFALGWRELAAWCLPTWQLTWRLVPVAAAVWWLARDWPPRWQLATCFVLPGIWGTMVFLRHGLNPSLRVEIIERMPSWMGSRLKQLARV